MTINLFDWTISVTRWHSKVKHCILSIHCSLLHTSMNLSQFIIYKIGTYIQLSEARSPFTTILITRVWQKYEDRIICPTMINAETSASKFLLPPLFQLLLLCTFMALSVSSSYPLASNETFGNDFKMSCRHNKWKSFNASRFYYGWNKWAYFTF